MANDSPAKSLVDIDLSSLRDPAGIFELVEMAPMDKSIRMPVHGMVYHTFPSLLTQCVQSFTEMQVTYFTAIQCDYLQDLCGSLKENDPPKGMALLADTITIFTKENSTTTLHCCAEIEVGPADGSDQSYQCGLTWCDDRFTDLLFD
ncbi:hypothetical protein STEG23_001124 [Scotinomys teguina]